MRQKFVDGIEGPTELFFFGNKAVDLIVTISTDRYRLRHLGSRKVLFEPLVLMTCARN